MRYVVALASLALAGAGLSEAAVRDCELSEEDARWIEDSIRAWRTVARDILRIEEPPSPVAVFFDASCVRSTDELRLDGGESEWQLVAHEGEIYLPTGETMPPAVVSFAAPLGDGEESFFVMSTPSVWRRGGVRSEIPLPTFMTAVLVHEISHTAQLVTYMRRVSELEKEGGFGDDLTDDVLQDTFGGNAEIAKAVQRETELLFRAAQAETEVEARRLAAEARDSIRSRRERYRDRRELYALEDVFLTLEGAAQWAAFAWLTSEDGGHVERAVAMKEFGRRTDHWSQVQGLALFLVIDRFVEDWESTVYGDGAETAFQLLDRAVGRASGR